MPFGTSLCEIARKPLLSANNFLNIVPASPHVPGKPFNDSDENKENALFHQDENKLQVSIPTHSGASSDAIEGRVGHNSPSPISPCSPVQKPLSISIPLDQQVKLLAPASDPLEKKPKSVKKKRTSKSGDTKGNSRRRRLAPGLDPVNNVREPVEIKYDKTRKNVCSLIVDKFKFTRSRDGANGRVFWRCSRRDCRATAITIKNVIYKVKLVHTHGAPPPTEFFGEGRSSGPGKMQWAIIERQVLHSDMEEPLAKRLRLCGEDDEPLDVEIQYEEPRIPSPAPSSNSVAPLEELATRRKLRACRRISERPASRPVLSSTPNSDVFHPPFLPTTPIRPSTSIFSSMSLPPSHTIASIPITNVDTLPSLPRTTNVSGQPNMASLPNVTSLSNMASFPNATSLGSMASLSNATSLSNLASIPNAISLANMASLPNAASLSNMASIPTTASLANMASLPNAASLPNMASIPTTASLANMASLPTAASLQNALSVSHLASLSNCLFPGLSSMPSLTQAPPFRLSTEAEAIAGKGADSERFQPFHQLYGILLNLESQFMSQVWLMQQQDSSNATFMQETEAFVRQEMMRMATVNQLMLGMIASSTPGNVPAAALHFRAMEVIRFCEMLLMRLTMNNPLAAAIATQLETSSRSRGLSNLTQLFAFNNNDVHSPNPAKDCI